MDMKSTICRPGFLGILALCLGMSLARAAEPVAGTQISARQEGMVLSVEGWLDTRADKATAWRVLTDYTRFPEFVPGIRSNRILEARNGAKLIEQRGEVIAGAFRMSYDGIMRVEERGRDNIQILFLSGPFKDVRGEWSLQAGRPLRLAYRMRMDLMKSPFPPPLAPGIAEQQVRTWVEVFGREMEREMELVKKDTK